MSSSSSSCRSQGRKLFEQSLSAKRNERLVENETTPLLAAESSCLLTEQNTTQSECLLTEQGGSWMRRVWRLALEALVSIYLGLIQVLGLMIRCKKRDAKSGAKQEHTSTEDKTVPEDFLLVEHLCDMPHHHSC